MGPHALHEHVVRLLLRLRQAVCGKRLDSTWLRIQLWSRLRPLPTPLDVTGECLGGLKDAGAMQASVSATGRILHW